MALEFPEGDRLSEREKQVVSALLLTGKSNVDLGRGQGVSRSAIDQVLRRVYQRLGLRSPIELFTHYSHLIPPTDEVKIVVVTAHESAIAPLLTLPTEEISKKLHLSTSTLEGYISYFYRKCGVRSRREFLSKRSSFRLVVGG